MKISASKVYVLLPAIPGMFLSYIILGSRFADVLELNFGLILVGVAPVAVGLMICCLIYKTSLYFDGACIFLNYPLHKRSHALSEVNAMDIVRAASSGGVAYCLKISSSKSEDICDIGMFNQEKLRSFLQEVLKTYPNITRGMKLNDFIKFNASLSDF